MIASQLVYSIMITIVIATTVNGNCPEDKKTYPIVTITNTSVNATPECVTPIDCKAWQKLGIKINGVYPIKPDNGPAFQVYCDMETNGGGWTVFQRRQDGSVDFNRYWTDYEDGFGNLTGEFWLGLSKINRLTKKESNTLRVDLGDFSNNKVYAQYTTFSVGNSTTEYTLTVGGYSGTAGDSLTGPHNGKKFTTRDNDNDNWSSGNCALHWHGGWWFKSCFYSHLNGQYQHTPSVSYANGTIWNAWKGWYYSLKFTEMKTRRNN